jgi:hypothetical protein
MVCIQLCMVFVNTTVFGMSTTVFGVNTTVFGVYTTVYVRVYVRARVFSLSHSVYVF